MKMGQMMKTLKRTCKTKKNSSDSLLIQLKITKHKLHYAQVCYIIGKGTHLDHKSTLREHFVCTWHGVACYLEHYIILFLKTFMSLEI